MLPSADRGINMCVLSAQIPFQMWQLKQSMLQWLCPEIALANHSSLLSTCWTRPPERERERESGRSVLFSPSYLTGSSLTRKIGLESWRTKISTVMHNENNTHNIFIFIHILYQFIISVMNPWHQTLADTLYTHDIHELCVGSSCKCNEFNINIASFLYLFYWVMWGYRCLILI